MPAEASPDALEATLKPLWQRAQAGDEAAYRQALQHHVGLSAARENHVQRGNLEVSHGSSSCAAQPAAVPRVTSRPIQATGRSSANPTRPTTSSAMMMSLIREEFQASQMKKPMPTPPISISAATTASA
jgi:hypothetical protein